MGVRPSVFGIRVTGCRRHRRVVYNPAMRLFLVTCLFSTLAFGQVGIFTGSEDIGASPIQGATEFDAATGQYRVTGSGTDIWGRSDQFRYVWREVSGDFTFTASAKFLTDGIAHRKAVLMLRKSLDPDSAYLDLALHGDGTPVVQFRNATGDTTNTVDLVTEGPGVWKLKVVRKGGTVTFWAAKDGAVLRELGHTLTNLRNPVLVGLGVSSHSQTAVNTVLFSDVSLEMLPDARK